MADSSAVDASDAVQWFLIIGALAAGVAGLVMLVGRFVPALGDPIRAAIGGQELVLAAMVAVGLTLGSLYLSEVLGYLPCRFCWFQRIAGYPIAVILAIALVRRDRTVWPYVLGLAVPGALLSLYHIAIQEGLVSEGTSCDPTNPCSTKWGIDDKLGLTIPMMALCCFVFLIAIALLAHSGRSIDADDRTSVATTEEP